MDCGQCCMHEANEYGAETETAVKTVLHLSKITMSIFLEVKGMVGSRESGFEIAKDSVHGSELRVLRSLATSEPCHRDALVCGATSGHRTETLQAIRLPDRTSFALMGTTLGTAAAWANKAIGSACSSQHRMALRLRPVTYLKFRHRQPSLKLHFVHRHDTSSYLDVPILTSALAHQMRLAEVS